MLFPLVALAQVHLGGFVEGDVITYFENPNPEVVNGRNQVILQTELRHEQGQRAAIFGAIEFRYDQADLTRNRVYLDEAYINLYLGALDLRVGKQRIAWGRADGFNPTDNLSAWDFSDLLDTEDEKLGLVAVSATYYVGDWSLAAVLAPSFVPSVLPGQRSRWWPTLPMQIDNPAYPSSGPPLIPVTYTLSPPQLPDARPQNAQYGIRLDGFVRGWDVSVSWFDGFDDLPTLREFVVPDPSLTTVDIQIEQTYHRRRAVGMDAATTVGALGIHAETAYFLTEDWEGTDPAVDDPYIHFVAGLDYTLNDLLADHDVFLVLEWSQEVQIPDRQMSYRATDLNHVFRKALFGKADLKWDTYKTLTLEGVYAHSDRSFYLQPGLDWSIADGIVLRVGVDLPGGPASSFFGGYKTNKRVQARLKYSF